MSDTPEDSKLTQTKSRWAQLGKFLTGHTSRPEDSRLPPGQHETHDFPVLSMGPTPRVDLAAWRFTLSHGPRPLASWSWEEFNALPQTRWQGDIHCVTSWS